MKKGNILAIVIMLFTLLGIYQYYKYWDTLKEEESEVINSVYETSFKGIVSYIEKYNGKDSGYVFSVIDGTEEEKTFGKVVISNFSNAVKGDSIEKRGKTFEMKIKLNGSWKTATLKYN